MEGHDRGSAQPEGEDAVGHGRGCYHARSAGETRCGCCFACILWPAACISLRSVKPPPSDRSGRASRLPQPERRSDPRRCSASNAWSSTPSPGGGSARDPPHGARPAVAPRVRENGRCCWKPTERSQRFASAHRRPPVAGRQLHVVEDRSQDPRRSPAPLLPPAAQDRGRASRGYPRVLGLAWAISPTPIAASIRRRAALRERLSQRVQPLTIGDWAVAITLRIVLVENSRRAARSSSAAAARARPTRWPIADPGGGQRRARRQGLTPRQTPLSRGCGAAGPAPARSRSSVTPAVQWLNARGAGHLRRRAGAGGHQDRAR